MNNESAGEACLCHTGMAGEVADLLGSLAHEQRLMIVALLVEIEELNVTAMAEKLNTNRAALSRHLGKLRKVGVVATRRHHNRVYYTLNHDKVARILSALDVSLTPMRS